MSSSDYTFLSENGFARDIQWKPVTWLGQCIYLLLSCNGAVGFGNVSQFPFCFKENGGISFIVTYLMTLIFVGFPLLVNELVLGQMCQGYLFDVIMAADGRQFLLLGTALMISWMTICYYNTLLAWALSYLFNGFSQPWLPTVREETICNALNEVSCNKIVIDSMDTTILEAPTYNFCRWLQTSLQTSCVVDNLKVSQHYFKYEQMSGKFGDYILEDADGFSYLQLPAAISEIKWGLFPVYLLPLIAIYCSLSFGNQVLGSIVMVAGFLPVVLNLLLLGISLSLPGFGEGFSTMLKESMSWETMLTGKTIQVAVTQAVFSLSLGNGVMLGYASSNAINSPIGTNALVIIVFDTFFALSAVIIMYANEARLGQNFMEGSGSNRLAMFAGSSISISLISENRYVTGIIQVCWWALVSLLGWTALLGFVENFFHSISDSSILQVAFPAVSLGSLKRGILVVGFAFLIGLAPLNVSDMGSQFVRVIEHFVSGHLIIMNNAVTAWVFAFGFKFTEFAKKVGKKTSIIAASLPFVWGCVAASFDYLYQERKWTFGTIILLGPIGSVGVLALFSKEQISHPLRMRKEVKQCDSSDSWTQTETVDDEEGPRLDLVQRYIQRLKSIIRGPFIDPVKQAKDCVMHRSTPWNEGCLWPRFQVFLLRWCACPLLMSIWISNMKDIDQWVIRPELDIGYIVFWNGANFIPGSGMNNDHPNYIGEGYVLLPLGLPLYSCPYDISTVQFANCIDDPSNARLISCHEDYQIPNLEKGVNCMIRRNFHPYLLTTGMLSVFAYVVISIVLVVFPSIGKAFVRDPRVVGLLRRVEYAFGFWDKEVDWSTLVPESAPEISEP